MTTLIKAAQKATKWWMKNNSRKLHQLGFQAGLPVHIYCIFRVLSFWGLILGLFLLLVLRISYITVNPIWSDVTSNSAVLLIAVIATLNKIYTGYIISVSQSGPRANCLSTKLQDSKVSGSGWFLVALGFGALMFLTHDVFGEVSLICRWAVSGYPHTGPKPNPWGYVHVMYFLLSVVNLKHYLCRNCCLKFCGPLTQRTPLYECIHVPFCVNAFLHSNLLFGFLTEWFQYISNLSTHPGGSQTMLISLSGGTNIFVI